MTSPVVLITAPLLSTATKFSIVTFDAYLSNVAVPVLKEMGYVCPMPL